MNPDTKDDLLTLVLLVFLFISGITVGWVLRDSRLISIKLSSTQINNTNTNCTNLSLKDTTVCLTNELSNFYFFNISNSGKELTLEQLKSQGGVCHNAAEYYMGRINNDKIYSKDIIIDVNETISHEFVIISNRDGWCYLDQKLYGCVMFNTDLIAIKEVQK